MTYLLHQPGMGNGGRGEMIFQNLGHKEAGS